MVAVVLNFENEEHLFQLNSGQTMYDRIQLSAALIWHGVGEGRLPTDLHWIAYMLVEAMYRLTTGIAFDTPSRSVQYPERSVWLGLNSFLHLHRAYETGYRMVTGFEFSASFLSQFMGMFYPRGSAHGAETCRMTFSVILETIAPVCANRDARVSPLDSGFKTVAAKTFASLPRPTAAAVYELSNYVERVAKELAIDLVG